jgi:hypothetical protein
MSVDLPALDLQVDLLQRLHAGESFRDAGRQE